MAAGAKRKELDPAEVERLAGEGLALYQIAQALGCSWDTLHRRAGESAEIAEALKRGEQAAIGKVENALFANAMSGNLGAQCFFLKNRAPHRWKDKTEQVITANVQADTLNDDFLASVAAASGAGAATPAQH